MKGLIHLHNENKWCDVPQLAIKTYNIELLRSNIWYKIVKSQAI